MIGTFISPYERTMSGNHPLCNPARGPVVPAPWAVVTIKYDIVREKNTNFNKNWSKKEDSNTKIYLVSDFTEEDKKYITMNNDIAVLSLK